MLEWNVDEYEQVIIERRDFLLLVMGPEKSSTVLRVPLVPRRCFLSGKLLFLNPAVKIDTTFCGGNTTTWVDVDRYLQTFECRLR